MNDIKYDVFGIEMTGKAVARIGIALCILFILTFFVVCAKVSKQIEEEGLKGIFGEIWEGKKKVEGK